jgi:hypothetical protein
LDGERKLDQIPPFPNTPNLLALSILAHARTQARKHATQESPLAHGSMQVQHEV